MRLDTTLTASADMLGQLTHNQRQRLSYLEFCLYFLGEVRRADMMARFDCAPAVVTRDIALYKQLAAAIRQARVAGLEASFFTVSFVGTDNFIAEAGLAGDGVHISQVVPSPQNRASALIRQYQADVPAADIGYASLEGYIDAAVFVAALREAGRQPTRAALVQALAFLQVDLGGFAVAFSPNDHQGSDAVFITRVQAGQAVPVERLR